MPPRKRRKRKPRTTEQNAARRVANGGPKRTEKQKAARRGESAANIVMIAFLFAQDPANRFTTKGFPKNVTTQLVVSPRGDYVMSPGIHMSSTTVFHATPSCNVPSIITDNHLLVKHANPKASTKVNLQHTHHSLIHIHDSNNNLLAKL